MTASKLTTIWVLTAIAAMVLIAAVYWIVIPSRQALVQSNEPQTQIAP